MILRGNNVSIKYPRNTLILFLTAFLFGLFPTHTAAKVPVTKLYIIKIAGQLNIVIIHAH